MIVTPKLTPLAPGTLVLPMTLAITLALALAGCSAPESTIGAQNSQPSAAPTSDSQMSEESLVMSETGWLSVSDDGEVYKTYLDPDGRYRDMRDGAIAFTGAWEQTASGELCFDPDAGTSTCWSHGSPGLDNTMRAENPVGRAIELRRIAYAPPQQSAEGEDGAEDGGDEPADDPAASGSN